MTTTNINPSLQDFATSVDAMDTHPTNPRRGNVEAIKESLTRFGQVRPVIVQKSSGFIVAGNHTYRAVCELGWPQIAAVGVDMTDEEAEAYLVADNRLSDLGDYDNAVLAPLLERMMLAGRLDGTGYSPDDVDDMLSAMNALPEVDPGETEAEHADSEAIKERFANRTVSGPQRQFVLLYDQGTGQEVEQLFARLKRAWGMERTIDVALEALRKAEALLGEAEREAAGEPEEPVAEVEPDTEVHSPQTGEVTQVSAEPVADGFVSVAPDGGPADGFEERAAAELDASDTADAQEDEARERPQMVDQTTAAEESLAEQQPDPFERTQPGYKRVSNVEAGRDWADDDEVQVKRNDDGSITLVNKKRWEVTRDEGGVVDMDAKTFGAYMNARQPA